jgi:hypothetical protein
VHGGAVNENTGFQHYIFDVTQAHPILQLNEHLAQGVNNRTLSEIKHELDGRF